MLRRTVDRHCPTVFVVTGKALRKDGKARTHLQRQMVKFETSAVSVNTFRNVRNFHNVCQLLGKHEIKIPFKGVHQTPVCATMGAHLTYRIVSTLQTPTQGDPTVLSISLEGTFIAVGSADGHVFVWCLRTYKLVCQTSPPLDEYGATDTGVTNMTWMPNGLLVFSRENGLMGVLLVGKVRDLAQ